MNIEKINIANWVASIELEGIDKIKQDLKEIEDSLDRILSKYEKMAAHEVIVQEQPKMVLIEEFNNLLKQEGNFTKIID